MIAAVAHTHMPIEDGPDEVSLIERLQGRDHTALAMVYDLYGRRVYAVILSMVRNVGIAEDLVQETFFRVWMRVESFDAKRGAFGPWLLTVARNRAVDHICVHRTVDAIATLRTSTKSRTRNCSPIFREASGFRARRKTSAMRWRD